MAFLVIVGRRRSWDLCLNHVLHPRLPRVPTATVRTLPHRAQPRSLRTMVANLGLPPRDSRVPASPQRHLCLMTLTLLITEWAMGITEKARTQITTLTCRIITGRMAAREYHNPMYRMYRKYQHLLKRGLLRQQHQRPTERQRNGKKKNDGQTQTKSKSHLIFAVFAPGFLALVLWSLVVLYKQVYCSSSPRLPAKFVPPFLDLLQ